MLDAAFAERFAKRYEGRPEWERPELWPVVMDPSRASQREWIAETLCHLPIRQRNNALARLQKDEQFTATYNELATTAILLSKGMQVEVEREFTFEGSAFTPDISVCSRDGDVVAIGEVATRFRSAKHRSAGTQWQELRSRVNRIPRPLGIVMQGTNDDCQPPSSGDCAKIEKGLRDWLIRSSTGLGSNCTIGDYAFHVAVELPGLRAQIAVPTGSDWYNTDMVRSAISAKAKRYVALAGSLGVPLFIVLAAEPALPLNRDLVRSAVEGRQAMSIALDLFAPGAGPIGPIKLNQRDTPAEFDPALSAVAWLEPSIDTPGSMTAFAVASSENSRKIVVGNDFVFDDG